MLFLATSFCIFVNACCPRPELLCRRKGLCFPSTQKIEAGISLPLMDAKSCFTKQSAKAFSDAARQKRKTRDRIRFRRFNTTKKLVVVSHHVKTGLSLLWVYHDSKSYPSEHQAEPLGFTQAETDRWIGALKFNQKAREAGQDPMKPCDERMPNQFDKLMDRRQIRASPADRYADDWHRAKTISIKPDQSRPDVG